MTNVKANAYIIEQLRRFCIFIEEKFNELKVSSLSSQV